MGQYYRPIWLSEDHKPLAWIYSHDVKSKHTTFDGKSTYMGGEGLKLMEHSYLNNPLVGIVENLMMPGSKFYKSPLVWAGDYADHEPGNNQALYGMAEDRDKIDVTGLPRKVGKTFRYILNWDLKQYVDKEDLKKDPDGFTIHPLPLLTCEGNGQDGGDFRGHSKLVGSWARHHISIETKVPEGFVELKPVFVENY